MSYYPNYYNYQNPYGGNQFSNTVPMQNQQFAPIPAQVPQINGKIVESEEIVKVTDIPIGSYAVFPKADLSEVYIKTWNNNGTTNIITFKANESISLQSQDDNITKILNKIDTLETTLNNFINTKATSIENVQEEKPIVKKGVNLNEY